MPGKTADALQALLEAGDTDGCVRFFSGASESERQALSKTAEKWMQKVSKEAFVQVARGHFAPNPLLDAAGAAVLGACPLSTVVKLGWRALPNNDKLFGVLAERRPKWLDDYAEGLLEGDNPSWLLVRRLMKAGLCRKPKHDNYVLGMVHLHAGVGGFATNPGRTKGPVSKEWCILSHLDAEPDLLEDVWRLFEIEGGGEYSLAAHDKYARGENRWDQTFVALAERGTFPRERLLDASLDALDRGFAQFRAGWFSTFHELLKPTIDERAARSERYLRLLASPIPPTVSFALTAIETIDGERPLAAGTLIDGLRPLMLARAKGTVKSALKLLDRVARHEPKHAARIARVASEALACEASDVQSAALKLIETHGARSDKGLVEVVTRARGLVAASLRAKIGAWLEPAEETGSGKKHGPKGSARSQAPPAKDGGAISKADVNALEKRAARQHPDWRRLAGVDRALAALQAGTLDLAACGFDSTEFPRLRADRAVEQIETLDDLIDASLAAIENPDDYDGLERVYDGVSRLCDQRPADFDRRTGPLRKRATQLLSRQGLIPFIGNEPLADLLGIILSFLTGEFGTLTRIKIHDIPAIEYRLWEIVHRGYVPNEKERASGLSQRAKDLAERVVKRRSAPLLAAPTHAGGWIDPVVLAGRVRTMDGAASAGDVEQVLSLLRLAPERRAETLPLLQGLKGEYMTALRHALGDPSVRVGDTSWLWAAAARARSPWSDDERVARSHPALGPDAGTAAQPAWNAIQKNRFTYLQIRVSPEAPKEPDLRLLAVSLWRRSDGSVLHGVPGSAAAIRQLQTIWPAAQEACFALAAAELAGNLDWVEACWWNRTWLEPLLDPDVPLRPMALLVLALGLAAKAPGEHGLATDAAIAAIHDGRLDGTKLGTLMAELLPTGLIKAARWAKTLADVARASPVHGEVVRIAVSRSLRGDIQSQPKDLHALVELLKELVAETESPVDDDTRAFLAPLRGSTKLAKAAQMILACSRPPDAARAALVQRAVVESRLSRVERWTSTVDSRGPK